MTKKESVREGRLEKFARLAVIKNIGGFALAAAGAVLLPPAGAAMAAGFAAGEGVGIFGSTFVHEKLKNRRLKKLHNTGTPR